MRLSLQTKPLNCRACVIVFLLFIFSVVAAHGNSPDHKRNSQQVERSVAADPRVVVSACIVSGDVRVHGWDRNEVRARISDGVQITLTRVDQTKSQTATELKLTAKENRPTKESPCLLQGDLELDVPRAGSVKLQTNSGDISVTEVARVNATSLSGTITLVKVHDEAIVNGISGEISAHDSTGSFKLHTVSGSVDARDLAPAGPGAVLEANTTSGDVTMDRIQHQRVSVNTVNGEVKYTGPLARGGRYSFQGISGQLRLFLPANSSFRFSGTVGVGGDFHSDFNLKDEQPDVEKYGPTRHLEGVVGSGDASINASVFSGSIQIRKQRALSQPKP